MEDDKFEARNPLPLDDGFLDALGPDDSGLTGLFGEWPPTQKKHLVALVSNLKNNFQKTTTFPALIIRYLLDQESKGVVHHKVRQLTPMCTRNQQWLETRVTISLGQLLKLAPSLDDYLAHHALLRHEGEP
jgi:hypothetical protein